MFDKETICVHIRGGPLRVTIRGSRLMTCYMYDIASPQIDKRSFKNDGGRSAVDVPHAGGVRPVRPTTLLRPFQTTFCSRDIQTDQAILEE